MAKRVDLGNGEWMDLREDITMADMETIESIADKGGNVHLAIECVGILVESWHLKDAVEPTPSNVRKMPVNEGTRLTRPIGAHLTEILTAAAKDSPDFSDAIANSPS